MQTPTLTDLLEGPIHDARYVLRVTRLFFAQFNDSAIHRYLCPK